ncbi:hypothetical protein D3C81_1633230 [compost metagenome]
MGLLVGNHVLQALVRRVGGNGQHIGRLHRHADVVEILERIVAGVPGQVRPDNERAQRRHEHRVAIGRRALDHGGADHAGRARLVVDHEAAAELRLHPGAQDAGNVVAGAARGERYQQRDRFFRPGGVRGGHGCAEQQGSDQLFHGLSPVCFVSCVLCVLCLVCALTAAGRIPPAGASTPWPAR